MTPDAHDGVRVLVDRIWPRGVSKERAALDHWLKEVAPSNELRTWWNHDPDRMAEFASRYRAELADNETLAQLRQIGSTAPVVTLLYAAKDPDLNQARVLQELLESECPETRPETRPETG